MKWKGKTHPKLPIFLTIPHSGERVPPEAFWLMKFERDVLLTDVDRFVDELYEPAFNRIPLPALVATTHRYVVDLNRLPEDVDSESVKGSSNAPRTHTKGFHWVETTQGVRLMKEPIDFDLHRKLVDQHYSSFHDEIMGKADLFHSRHPNAHLIHLDLHSMPSVGTGAHADPGKKRADVVVSDCDGKSASPVLKDLVIQSYQQAGFQVAYNDPYHGGRITQRYGDPSRGHHTLQIELNRALYMDESTKQKNENFRQVQEKLFKALEGITQSFISQATRASS